MNPKTSSSLIVLIAFLNILWLLGCERNSSPEETPPLKKPNVIIITLDTTRADRLGCYGNETISITPSLDALAQDGTTFLNTISPVPLTLPSHSTLFTGMYPLGHGVRTNIGFHLSEEFQTLAECFKAEGYQTSAFIGAAVLKKKYGLGQGFDTYEEDFPKKQYHRNAETVLTLARQWFEKEHKDPAFVWIHLFDPHHPYEHPEPFRSQFAAHPYNGEVAYMDAEIGKFLDFLKQTKRYDPSLIVVVGDHGESLNEHGEETHAYFTYDATLKIPFILKEPYSKQRRQKITDQVRLADVMPTLLKKVGFPVPSSVQGEDLSSLIQHKKNTIDVFAYGESYYPYYQYGFCPLQMLRTNQYKLITDGRGVELYDLQKDPNELNDISPQHPTIVQDMEMRLKVFVENYSRKVDSVLIPDDDTLNTLGALGYASSVLTDLSSAEKLPRPKESIKIHQGIIDAYVEMDKENYPKAQEKLHKVFLAHPDLILALEIQTKLYVETFQFEKAIQVIKKILSKHPEDPVYLIRLASCYYQAKNIEKSIETLKFLGQVHPDYRPAKRDLWNLYLVQNQIDTAVAEIQAEIKRAPQSGFGWYWLGEILQKQKKWDEAKEAYLKALQDKTSFAISWFRLGVVYEQLKDSANALKAFQQVIHSGDSEEDYFIESLKKIATAHKDKPEQAIPYLKRAVQLQPENFSVCQTLIDVYLQQQKWDEAQRLVEQGLKMFKTKEERFTLIQCLERLNRPREAFQQMLQLLQAEPFYKDAYLYLGHLSLKIQMWDQAKKSFQSYLELSSTKDPEYQNVLQLLQKIRTE